MLIVGQERDVAREIEDVVSRLGGVVSRVEDEAALWTSVRTVRPDVAVLDVDLGEPLAGLRVAQALYEELGTRVVYLSTHSAPEIVARAKQTRPYGYLLRPVRAVELGICLELALHRAEAPTRTHDASALSAAGLTRRERDVLRLIAHGHTSKDIASQLAIAKPTVDTYRARLLEKLGARNRAELVRVARRMGL